MVDIKEIKESEASEFVYVRDLAKELCCDRGRLLQTLKKSNIVLVKLRDRNIKNQLCSAISTADAERYKAERLRNGFGSTGFVQENVIGRFVYIVAVDPDKRPERVKVGTTGDMQQRLLAYTIICPEAVVLRLWEVPERCEGYLISLASVFGEMRGQELFDIEDLSQFLSAADMAFAHFSD